MLVGRSIAASAPWPITAACRPSLSVKEQSRVEELGHHLFDSRVASHARAYAKWYARDRVRSGCFTGPILWVEDHRGIELISDSVARSYEYRSLALARTGDTLLISRPHDHVFEHYVYTILGLGSPRVIRMHPAKNRQPSLYSTCMEDNLALNQLTDKARQAGCLTIAPFRSSGYTWQLARTIADRAKVPVSVASANPPLTRAANNKLWFSDVVHALLGPQSAPPTSRVFSIAAASERLSQMARQYPRLVLKTPSSAGATGNIVLEGSILKDQSLIEIRNRLVRALSELGSAGYKQWPMLLGVWEDDVSASPSLQCWIPEAENGEPIVEGIYEQHIVGRHGMFVGAQEADLPGEIADRIEREGFQLALILQKLGYFGRASFDSLVIESNCSTPDLHWIECNARWGGVSIPMAVLRRLGIKPGDRGYVIAQLPVNTEDITFRHVLDASAEFEYDRLTRTGIVWLTPPDVGRSNVSFIAIAQSTMSAHSMANRLITLFEKNKSH